MTDSASGAGPVLQGGTDVTLVESDEHGPFVRTGGWLFRPGDGYTAATGLGVPFGFTITASTGHAPGATVTAVHRPGTPFADVDTETWLAETRSAAAQAAQAAQAVQGARGGPGPAPHTWGS